MKSKKLLLLMLTMIMLTSVGLSLSISVSASESRYSNFYAFTKTGNSAKDVVAAAMAQKGRTESSIGYVIDAKGWCADFVCDAAAFAGISSSIVPYTYSGRGNPNALLNYMLTNCGAKEVSVPQAGDFIFYYCTSTRDYSHVGIMTDSTNSIHGNLLVDGARRVFYMPYSYYCCDVNTKCYTVRFVRPNYSNQTCTHIYADATCTSPKTCKSCGATSGSALGHIYSNSSDTNCNRCGAKRALIQRTTCDFRITIPANYNVTLYDTETSTTASSRWLSAQSSSYTLHCDQKIVLTNGQVRYKFVSGDKYTCYFVYDSSKMSETVKHNDKSVSVVYAKDCDHTGYEIMKCTSCGREAKKPTWVVGPHSYTNSCDTTCNVCGTKRTIKHTYSNNCDTKCNVCSTTRKINHTYKTTTTKATLTKNGSIVKKCTVCGKVSSNTAIKYVKTIKLSATSYTYDGKTKTPSVTVKDSAGKTLKKDTDYTVTYASGRKNAGTYKVTVKMKGNYTGTKTLTFKINPAKISSYKLSTTSYTYDGKVKKPTVTVKNSSGTKLTTSSYTVTYASGRKNVGTYKVTIKGKGNYTGTKTLTFKINPAKTTVSKLTAGKKSITVAISKKSTQVTGYQIQYSTSKKFTSAKTKTISSYKTTKYTLKSLSAKKTYYVRVRTYKTVGKTKYYSGWSTYKYVKTK